MKVPHQAHVAIVDGERFVLMRNTGQMFEPRLEVVGTPELERTNYSAGVRHQDEGGQRKGSTDLEELAHGAAVAEWLNARAISGEIEQLVVVADPKTLGEMRRHYHKELQQRLAGEVAKAVSGEPSERIAEILVAS